MLDDPNDEVVFEDLGMVPLFCTEYLVLIFFTNWPRVKHSTSVSFVIPLFSLENSAEFLSSPLTVFVFAHAVCLDSSRPTIDTSPGISLPGMQFVTFTNVSFGFPPTISDCFILLILQSVLLSEKGKGLLLSFRKGNVAPFATSLFTITVEEMVLGASLVEVTSEVSWSAEDLTAVSLLSLLEDELLYREVYLETGE